MAKRRKPLPIPPRVVTLGDLVAAEEDFGFESCPMLSLRGGQKASLVRLSLANLHINACFGRVLERDNVYAISILASDSKQLLAIRPVRKEQYLNLSPDAAQRDSYVVLPGTDAKEKGKQVRITGLIESRPWLKAQIEKATKQELFRYPRWKRALGVYVLEREPVESDWSA